MFDLELSPMLFHLGGLALGWYGLLIALGVAVGTVVAARQAHWRGLTPDHIYDMALWLIIAGIVGARLFHVLDYWDYYATNPGALLTFQQSGLAIYGAIVGGILAALLFAWRRGLSFWKLADVVVLGLPLGQAIGRIGCFINGCNYGYATELPWGVRWRAPGAMVPDANTAYQPAQLYEGIVAAGIFALLWPLRKRVQSDGILFLLYLILYALTRFAISFTRPDNLIWLGLRQAQIVSLLLLVVAVPLLLYLLSRQQSRVSLPA
jgi:phosphatidylglycerol---prolipoprotein diacylglyceryl transferase